MNPPSRGPDGVAILSTPIEGPLQAASFERRLNRFLIQVRLDDTGIPTEAHMADPGRLLELLIPGKRIWLRPAKNPQRKTRWTAVLVESPSGDQLVSLDTTLPNRLIKAALSARRLDEFQDWSLERAEVTMGRSRLDFLLRDSDGTRLALEVKSVTLVEDSVGLFPDAVTERGARHVKELAEIASKPGWEAALLFVLQRSDAHRIVAARHIDPGFSKALDEARDAGVRILGRRCQVFLDRLELGPHVPVGVE